MLALWFIASARAALAPSDAEAVVPVPVLSALAAELSSSNEGNGVHFFAHDSARRSHSAALAVSRAVTPVVPVEDGREELRVSRQQRAEAHRYARPRCLEVDFATLVQRHEERAHDDPRVGTRRARAGRSCAPRAELRSDHAARRTTIERRALRVSEEAARTIRAPFNLSDGPLVRLRG